MDKDTQLTTPGMSDSKSVFSDASSFSEPDLKEDHGPPGPRDIAICVVGGEPRGGYHGHWGPHFVPATTTATSDPGSSCGPHATSTAASTADQKTLARVKTDLSWSGAYRDMSERCLLEAKAAAGKLSHPGCKKEAGKLAKLLNDDRLTKALTAMEPFYRFYKSSPTGQGCRGQIECTAELTTAFTEALMPVHLEDALRHVLYSHNHDEASHGQLPSTLAGISRAPTGDAAGASIPVVFCGSKEEYDKACAEDFDSLRVRVRVRDADASAISSERTETAETARTAGILKIMRCATRDQFPNPESVSWIGFFRPDECGKWGKTLAEGNVGGSSLTGVWGSRTPQSVSWVRRGAGAISRLGSDVVGGGGGQ